MNTNQNWFGPQFLTIPFEQHATLHAGQHMSSWSSPIKEETTFRPPALWGEVHRCLTTHRTLCYDSACSLAETSHLFHSQTETTKQTTLHNMLDPDGFVHLETNGQTFIYLLQSLWTFASDSCHLLANVLRLWAEAS
jgi:hypothetical protein